jgi:hypothetical protein
MIDQGGTLTGSSNFQVTEVCVLLDWADLSSPSQLDMPLPRVFALTKSKSF